MFSITNLNVSIISTYFFLAFCTSNALGTNMCYNNASAFNTACTQLYDGVQNGARCFFVMQPYAVNQSKTCWGKFAPTTCWNTYNLNALGGAPAAALCATVPGATLAQIHTASEYNSIMSMFQSTGCMGGACGSTFHFWVNIFRLPTSTNTTGYWLDLQNSYWGDSNCNYDSRFLAKNMWIRTKETVSSYTVGNNCTTIGGNGVFYDYTNAHHDSPLCEITNHFQTFTYYPNVCMGEFVMLTPTVSSENDCASECTSYSWCRSFNFFTNNNLCQLFTWTIVDTSNTAAQANCVHYSYAP